MARVVRAQIVPVMEGIPLWHERDISHSSTERVFLPDAAITTDYLLDLTAGLARVVRAAIVPVMEGIPLWHERDISHSSTERVFLPDAAITTDYLLHLTTRLVEGLVVDADRMRANLESTGGLIYTSSVLLELVEGGLSREDAYALVQSAAMETWNSGTPFRETLRKRASSSGVALDEARLDEICRPEQYVANLGPLFDRLAALS